MKHGNKQNSCASTITSNSQATYLEHCKSTQPEYRALIILDFAENCSFIIENAIQGYHWNSSQATLHPFIIYKKNQANLTHESVCIKLDHTKHDSSVVHTFLEKLLNVLKIKYPKLQKCIYISVGAGSQYKNCKAFCNLYHHEPDFGLQAEWNLFATFHEKIRCVGIEGTVKGLVGNASLWKK